MNTEYQIIKLLYRYAEYIDSGDLPGAAALFTHARMKMYGAKENETVDAASVLAAWRRAIILYPCGTPRTKHAIINPIVDIAADGLRATSRSVFVVYQQTPNLPLQPVASGRYHDEFMLVDGAWRFSYRDYSLLDFIGEVSQHARDLSGASQQA